GGGRRRRAHPRLGGRLGRRREGGGVLPPSSRAREAFGRGTARDRTHGADGNRFIGHAKEHAGGPPATPFRNCAKGREPVASKVLTPGRVGLGVMEKDVDSKRMTPALERKWR